MSVTPTSTSTICPQCIKDVGDTTTNRIVIENCGHKKCRNCLIKEDNGCVQCKLERDNENISDQQQQQQQQPPINQETTNAPKRTSKNHKSKTRSGEKKNETFIYPSHLLVKIENKKEVYNCTLCQSQFKSKSNRIYHLYCDTGVKKPYKCSDCDKSFITASHLKYHAFSHKEEPQPQFECDQCDKKFQRLPSLRKHKKGHNGNFKFSCSLCNKKFLYKDQYTLHKNKHDGINPHRCDICNKSFLLKSNLNQHKLIHEENVKTFSCDLCKKQFTRKQSLKEHMELHLSVIIIACKFCEKTFSNQKCLMRHATIHNKQKYYKCKICGIESHRKDNIKRHFKNLHPSENQLELLENIISVVDIKLNKKEEDTTVQKISSIPQSVIKFAAKAQQPQVENPEMHLDKNVIHQETNLITLHSQPELTIDVDVHQHHHHHSDVTTLEEKCTQRKLLSPYLKPPPAVLNNAILNNTTDPSAAAEAFPKIQPPKTTPHTKKTLDQFEMYRRILMSNEPDEEEEEEKETSGQSSAAIDSSQKDRNSKKEDTTTNQPSQDLISNTENATTNWKHSKEYFSEMHWRKRTSQCFISQSDFQLT